MMTTYNHERFIAQAIESVLSQATDFPMELVIGEDCSTDGTRAIALDYRRRFPDIVRVVCSNRNVGMLRNARQVLALCRGEYIAKLEGDDYWIDPLKTGKQAAFLDTHADVAICYTNAVEFYDDRPEEKRAMIRPGGRKPFIDLAQLVKGNQLVEPTKMFRRFDLSILPELYFKGTQGDWPLSCLLAQSGLVAYIDEVTAAYRHHPGGVYTRRTEAEKIYKHTRTQQSIDRMLDRRYHDIIAPILSAKFIRTFRTAVRGGEWSYAGRAVLRLMLLGAAERWPAGQWWSMVARLLSSSE